jgi:hypothetical protein
MAQQTARTYANSRLEAWYETAEVTFATGVDHAGTDAIPSDAECSIGFDFPRSEEASKRATTALAETVEDGEYTTNWSFPDSDFKPGAGAAVAPDMAPQFKALMGSQLDGTASTVTVAASPAPTTTVFTLSSATNLAVGKPIRFSGDQTAALAGKCRIVIALDGAAVTVAPALSVAPATGDTVTIGYGWPATTINELTNTKFHELENVVEAISGAWTNQGKFSISRNGRIKFGCGGEGCGLYSKVGTGTTTGTTAIGDLTMAVATGQGKRFRLSSGLPLYIRVGDEIIKVTAVSGDALTIVRAQKSTSAAEHLTGSVIVPWRPSRTIVGNPVACNNGEFLIDGAAFKIHSAEVSIDNGNQRRETDVGEQYNTTGVFRNGVNPFKVNFSLVAKLTKDTMDHIGYGIAGTTRTVHMAIGTAASCRFVMLIQKWQPDIAPISAGGGEAMLNSGGKCLETAGNDVVYFGQV